MASSRQECFLRNYNVVADRNVILIVEPHAFPDPRSRTDMEVPRKFHSCSGAKNDTFADVGAKTFENRNSQSGADLPRVGYK